jgi:hypothetical protein
MADNTSVAPETSVAPVAPVAPVVPIAVPAGVTSAVASQTVVALAAAVTPAVAVKKGDIFSAIGGFFGGALNSVNGFLNANPNVKNILDGALHVVVISGLTFVAGALAPASATAITVAGVAAAIGAGVKSYAVAQAESVVNKAITSIASSVPTTSTANTVLSGAPDLINTIATEAVAKATATQTLQQAKALVDAHVAQLTVASATIAQVTDSVAANTPSTPAK